MPNICCILGCNSRSGTTSISLFKIPLTGDVREAWLKVIPRKNFVPNKYSYVCSLHFKKEEIRYERYHGSLVFPLKVPQLTPTAVPSIWPQLPEFLKGKAKADKLSIKTGNVNSQSTKLDNLIPLQLKPSNDEIESFDSFKLLLASNIRDMDVEVKYTNEDVYVYKIKFDDTLTISHYIRISKNLNGQFYRNSVNILEFDQQFHSWSQFRTAVRAFYSDSCEDGTVDKINELLDEVSVKTSEIIDIAECIDYQNINILEQIMDQLKTVRINQIDTYLS